MTDGLVEAGEAQEAVLAVDQLQVYTHTHPHNTHTTHTHTHTHTHAHTHTQTHTHTLSHTYARIPGGGTQGAGVCHIGGGASLPAVRRPHLQASLFACSLV
jgi:hypothetical protein